MKKNIGKILVVSTLLVLSISCGRQQTTEIENSNAIVSEVFRPVLKKAIVNVIQCAVDIGGEDFDEKNDHYGIKRLYYLTLTMDYEHKSGALLTICDGIYYDSNMSYYTFIDGHLIILANKLEEINRWEPKLLDLVDIESMIPIKDSIPGYNKGIGSDANYDGVSRSYRIINSDSLELTTSLSRE